MIGIITLYHNSTNYGGNLQAYALYKYLENRGAEVEQISYKKVSDGTIRGKLFLMFENGFVSGIKGLVNSLKVRNEYVLADKKDRDIRWNSFQRFSKELIRHSDRVYDQNSICDCLDDYDMFITGSDQVWNLKWYDSTYFLDFVDGSKKKKLSYAASFSMKELTNAQKEIVANSLSDYEAISVREKDAATILEGLTDKTVTYVVDPTLLLEEHDWNKICAERVIKEEYVFGYFLGSNIEMIKKAKEFAKKRNLKLVMIPFAAGKYQTKADDLADISIVDASPEKFLSLIKYAEYIFTDSFHAVVFSFVFKKQFFVFNRDKKGSMNSRIISLTDMFELQERFCATKEQESLEYIEGLQEIDYSVSFSKFEECREKSYEFINKNILEQ